MSEIVTYEVYIYETTSWELVARYPVEKKSAAMEHARSLEYSQQRPTKVVKEIYTPEDQTFNEKMVYLSDIPKPVPQKRTRTKSDGFSLPTKNEKKKKKQSFAEAMMLLGATLVFSILISSALTYGIMRALIVGELISEEVASKFSLSIFILTFLCISIPLSVNWVDWSVLFDDEDKNENKIKKVLAEQDATKKKENLISSYRNDQASWLTKAFINFFAKIHNEKTLEELIEEENNRKKSLQTTAQKEDFEKAIVGENTDEDSLNETTDNDEVFTDENDAFEQDNLEENPKEDNSQNQQKNEVKQEENTLPSELEQEFLKLTTFLSLILKILQKQNILLNSFARFGIELFLAGSCETLCKRHHLSKQNNKQLVISLLELLGRTKNLAEIFYNRLEEYVLDKQYLNMIQSGSQALSFYLDNPTSPEVLTLIQNAMQNWTNPEEKDGDSDKQQSRDSGIVTVMFTDMVGSTHMTQKYGDVAAQQIVRAHNSIVRQALNACSGKEIKQTGDGIMASFAWASNAIDAAISIQKATTAYNNKNPTIPLKIRIGLNAGEPILEDNDLFGLTVQLAARTCAQAEAGQIFISNVVRELASGKNYQIENKGFFSLKGIEAEQNLHEVIWQSKNLDNTKRDNLESPTEESKQKLSQVLPEL
ncbi:MAG: adenylate/guanylate cyclase domain-containing protein [Alphaproteobacteria bacterium]|nr:adenylate/guanylate cyclase domain-containing protein [Alphaproteobacteria bacterium]